MPQTWFISLDFQLYLFHYLTMILLYRRPAAGFALAAIQAIGTCSYIFWRTYLNGYPAYLKVNEANIVNLYDTEVQYLNTFLHSTPYTIGVLTGYLIRRKITVNFSVRKRSHSKVILLKFLLIF